MTTTKPKKDTDDDWWHEKPNRNIKSKWTNAIEDYFEDDMSNIENEDFNMTTMKEMLATVAEHDERWHGFKAKKFNTKDF